MRKFPQKITVKSEVLIVIKDVRGFPEYKVTDSGDVIGKRGKIMRGGVDRNGYRAVLLSYYPKQKNAFVHRLVLSTFCPVENMDALDVNHKDGNKLNNNLENLEWCTRSENIKHSYANGLQNNVSNKHGNYRVLTLKDEGRIKTLHCEGLIDREIATVLGCSRGLVSRKIRKLGLR